MQLQSPIAPLTAAALRMIICKRPAPHFDNHKKGMKMHFWDPSLGEKMCFACQRIKFQWKKDQHFHIHLRSGRTGLTLPALRSAWP